MTRTPLGDLIMGRILDLGIDRRSLGFRLGYRNPARAEGRVAALCEGHVRSRKSRRALSRLASALDVTPEVVDRAVDETKTLTARLNHEAAEKERTAREREHAAWRASFVPHAIIETERTVPTQIGICALTGGPARWLTIRFDLSKPPITFVGQAVLALPRMLSDTENGHRYVPFFGEAVGFTVNYAPDRALLCDLEGRPIEVLDRARRLGDARLSLEGQALSLGSAGAQ